VSQQIDLNNYQTLLKIETGERPLKVAELARLCKLYSKDLTYFLQSQPIPKSVPTFAWRAQSDSGGTKRIQARIQKLLQDYRLLEEVTGEVRPNRTKPWNITPQEMTYARAAKEARLLKEDLRLGSSPAKCLAQKVEEELGIKILFMDLGARGSAVSVMGDEHLGVGIVINSTEAPWRRHFDLAHELFHILAIDTFGLTDHSHSQNEKSEEEKLADSFAASLLVPADELKLEYNKRSREGIIKWPDLIRIAQLFDVSTEALLWRLVTIGFLKRDRVKKILADPKLSALDKRARSGTNLPAQEYSDRFVWLGLKAMYLGKISRGKFCDIFGITRAQFDDFIAERGDLESFAFDSEITLDNT
jgi:Zn-dependent peptidase ImmA (M78 family)